MKNWLPWFAGGSVTLLVVFWLYMLWRERPRPLHPLDAAMLKVVKRVAVRFRPRRDGETIGAYCQDYAHGGGPDSAELLALCDQYHRLRYRHEIAAPAKVVAKTDRHRNDRLRSALAAFRRRASHFQ